MITEEQLKKIEASGFDMKLVNKLVSLSWLCVSSGMDAINELDEYMTKFGYKGLFYNDLRAVKRDYEVYAKKIRAAINGDSVSDYFHDFEAFNEMIREWAKVEEVVNDKKAVENDKNEKQ